MIDLIEKFDRVMRCIAGVAGWVLPFVWVFWLCDAGFYFLAGMLASFCVLLLGTAIKAIIAIRK